MSYRDRDCGAFSPRELRKKWDAEEKRKKRSRSPLYPSQTQMHVPRNTVGQRSSGQISWSPVAPSPGDLLTSVIQCIEVFHDLSLASRANVPIPIPIISPNPKALPQIQAAFAVEKISKVIFSLLEPEDLLRCRLVSSSWLRMATNDELLKSITFRHLTKPLEQFQLPGVLVNGLARPLKDLTDLLDKMGSHIIPFSGFTIVGMTVPNKDLENLLDRYGLRFKSLRIVFPAKDLKNQEMLVYRMDSLLEFFTQLLTQQMPNLETLFVEMNSDEKFTGAIDPRLLATIKKGLYFFGNQNRSLRYVDFCGKNIPYAIIDAVCCLAPKLEQVDVDDMNFWVDNRHRMHLLRRLSLHGFSRDSWREVETLERILNGVEKVDLKMLITNFFGVGGGLTRLLPYLATLVAKVFRKSCHSLEDLDLGTFYFLPGTVLPPMLNVKRLVLSTYPLTKPQWSWLPQGTSIVSTFPILDTIGFSGGTGITEIQQFLSLCKNEQVGSVKRIVISSWSRVDASVFDTRFPNAIVSRR